MNTGPSAVARLAADTSRVKSRLENVWMLMLTSTISKMFVCYDILAFVSIRPRRGHEQGRLLFLALGCGAGRRQASLQPCQQLLDIASLGQLRLKVCDLLLALGQRGVSSSYI